MSALIRPREENATPTWITSYNFVCLLNLPTMLATFGPLRNYWEGGGMGEKIIQHIKPLWNGFRKHWQLHLVDKLLKKMAIDRIQLHSMGHSGKNDNYIKEGKQFHSYKTKDEVYNQFNTRQPMSIIQLENGYYLIAMTKNTYVHITCTEYFGNISGFHYHYWQIAENNIGETESLLNITRCCFLLPRMKSTGLPTASEEPIYTVIDSDWNNMRANKSCGSPNIEDIL